MARKPTRSQLNQIRAWVRQGRTDAWIAHQLDVSTSELRDFIRRNELSAEEGEPDDSDLRDEIEAEIEAAMEAEDEEDDEEEEGDADDEEEPDEGGEGDQPSREPGPPADQRDTGGEGGGRRRRRRRRRGGAKRAGAGLEATFDHGDTDGYGLWLDPAVDGDPVYAEHWKGHRKVRVTIEPEQIVIRRDD